MQAGGCGSIRQWEPLLPEGLVLQQLSYRRTLLEIHAGPRTRLGFSSACENHSLSSVKLSEAL